MAENGAEIIIEASDTSSTRQSEEPESQDGEEDDGTRTPQAAAPAEGASRPQRGPQTITSMSFYIIIGTEFEKYLRNGLDVFQLWEEKRPRVV